MKISEDVKLDFDDVLIKPKRSTLISRGDVDYTRKFTTLHSKETIEGFPLMVANMDTVGTIPMLKTMAAKKTFVALHKYHTIEQLRSVDFETYKYGFVTIGEKKEDLDNICVPGIHCSHILIDCANGYRQTFVDAVKRVRNKLPKITIMAGNVCTPEMTEQLILSGADIVKCGIGPGSLCETRKKTGVGYPQISCILECKDAAHGLGGLICADGGIKNAGDAAKAFGAGADFLMVGSLFMGCDECEGEWEYDRIDARHAWIEEKVTEKQAREHGNKIRLKVYGMSSHAAQKKYLGEIQKHRASEGKEHTVEYKGPAEDVLDDIIGGVVSACSYVGARKLKDFDKCCSFVKVSRTHQSIF